MAVNSHLNEVIAAFDRDGWNVDSKTDVFYHNSGMGVRAHNKTATVGDGGPYKLAYYVQGDWKTMGYLRGFMAPDDVKTMTEQYTIKLVEMYMDKVVTLPDWIQDLLAHCLIYFGYLVAWFQLDVIPKELRDELAGIREGCKAAKTNISKANIWMLNIGADFLCGIVYNMMLPKNTPRTLNALLEFIIAEIKKLLEKKNKLSKLPKAFANIPKHLKFLLGRDSLEKFEDIEKLFSQVKNYKAAGYKLEDIFRMPHACNAFVARGGMTEPKGSTFMGRDFMFSTFGIMNKIVCFTIHQPVVSNKPLPVAISYSTPAFIGAFTGVNAHGVGIGVDMLPARNDSPWVCGLNSLMLNRAVIHNCHDVPSTLEYIRHAKRTVSWLHPIGAPDQGAIAEVTSSGSVAADKYLQKEYKEILQKARVPLGKLPDGMDIFNIDDTGVSAETRTCHPYLAVNKALFDQYCKDHPSFTGTYTDQGYTGDTGYLNPTVDDKNCCGEMYLTPTRRTNKDVIVTTNHALTLNMRMMQMDYWISDIIVSSKDSNSMQYRYDKLTDLSSKPMTWASAHQVIDFMCPTTEDWKTKRINAGICLMDLKPGGHSRIDGHYGFWGDQWVTLLLDGYALSTGTPPHHQE